MTCKICGKKLPEGSTTCKYCGASLQSKPAAANGKRRYSKKALARRRLIDMILIILALLLIAAVVIGISYSAKQAGKVGEESLLEADSPEAPETEQEDPIIPEEEEKEKPVISVKGEKDEEEEKLPEAATLEDPESKEEESSEPEREEAPQESAPVTSTPSGHYTVSINRTETTASLDHYRELSMSVNETLPAGVEVVSVVWTSSDPTVVRAEDGKAWGVSIGEATVTGTLTLSDGQSYTASCVVKVVEEQIVTYSDYILADSSTRLYTAAELSALTNDQLRIARNEIYARHGRKFNDSTLQQYFDSKSWYKGTISPDQFSVSVLNSVERENLYTIMAVEAAR